ncbi:hypothetical protein AB0D04_18165 [Streptomyces sp. NPDC048483]|uniref:hypothetical protein n=1 Tax=Streptomyces sp. NPDC048483 TaxID=3154927 RepID=UPI003420B69C
MAWFTGHAAKRTIGADKVNQLRHARLLRDADGLRAHMARHRAPGDRGESARHVGGDR